MATKLEVALALLNKVGLVLAALTSLIVSITALATDVLPSWALIFLMMSALLFLIVFITVLLGPPLSCTIRFGIVMFCIGSYGGFLAALETYLMEPTTPFEIFLRLNLISACFATAGALAILFDLFLMPMSKRMKLLFLFIQLGTLAILLSSAFAMTGSVLAFEITSLIGSLIFIGAALVNLCI